MGSGSEKIGESRRALSADGKVKVIIHWIVFFFVETSATKTLTRRKATDRVRGLVFIRSHSGDNRSTEY